MAKDKPTKIVSKKHLARLEREHRQAILITISAAVVLAVVVLLIAYGILSQTVLLLRQPILKVNNDVLTTREFQARVKVARQQLISQYMQYEQLAQMFGMDPSSDPSLSNYLNQITTQLDDPTTIGNQVIEEVKGDMVIRQYARDHGIGVSSQEVDQKIQESYGYYPNGTPTATATGTPLAFSTLSATQLFLESPTMKPTATLTLTPTDTPLFTPTVTLTATPTSTATSGPTPTPFPSPTPYTLEGFKGQYKEGLTYYGSLGLTETDFRTIFGADNLYRQKVEDAVITDFPYDQEEVWARQILVADQVTAQRVVNLLNLGGNWTGLTKQFSTDTNTQNTGGDMGWFPRSQNTTEFDNAAFALKIGEISQPVQDTNGWHIIQVLGHENRPLTADEYTTARDQKFQDWITQQLTTAKVTVYDYWTTRVPTSPTLQDAINSMSETQTAMQP